MRDGQMTLQRFLAALTEQLAALSVEQTRSALLAHAATLPGEQRKAFLDVFVPAVARSGRLETGWPAEDDPLLADIDAFAAEVASGAYFQGYGWDPELHDQRSFGDESWVFEMDGLFADAQEAFLGGQLGLARAAYGRLLDAFRLDEEVGTFCGPDPAVEMVATDIPEAEARYLRTVYETTPPQERADVLAQEWFALPGWRDAPTLRAVREALPKDLPDLDAFLPRWITGLKALDGDRPQVRRLLAEAVESSRGGGPGRAERYADWIGGLRRLRRDADAAEAAREALGALPLGGDVRAGIADQLAELSGGDAAAVLAARQEAWRAAPTQDRLVGLHLAVTAVGEPERLLTAEVEALAADAPPGRLRAALLLLAGRVDDAVDLLDAPPAPNPRDSAARVVLPYLLAAACSGPSHQTWASTRLAGLLRSVDDPHAWSWTVAQPRTGDGSSEARPPLSALLADRIVQDPEPPERRMALLTAALREIQDQVDAAVGGQHRARYPEAACLVSCGADAVTMEEDELAARTYVAMMRSRYPRHVAFRRELDKAVSGMSCDTSRSAR